jgi:hypothetical protein
MDIPEISSGLYSSSDGAVSFCNKEEIRRLSKMRPLGRKNWWLLTTFYASLTYNCRTTCPKYPDPDRHQFTEPGLRFRYKQREEETVA